MLDDLSGMARIHAALGDETRLAIATELATSDRTPRELELVLTLPSNLLAHHLGILERAGLVRRTRSEGDGRRRYAHLDRERAAAVGIGAHPPQQSVLFVCTHNSARSQMAAAWWEHTTGNSAASAGTAPSGRVHPRAIAVAHRHGVDIDGRRPTPFDPADAADRQVITVCDRAHEQLKPPDAWWHWSIPDPAIPDTPHAFEAAFTDIRRRIDQMGAPAT